jgi:hypothetical protein
MFLWAQCLDTHSMGSEDLAPLRRAQDLLVGDESVDHIITQLELLFGLDYVDALAAVAAVTLLNERGLAVPPERATWIQAGSF